MSNSLPPRKRWDRRYTQLSSEALTNPTAFIAASLSRISQRGRALDIATGLGRHAIFLAQHGFQVDAIDISSRGIKRAKQRAQNISLPCQAQIRFILADLELPWLPSAQYNLILGSFFLHRPLFPLIKQRLTPGGWFIYETFIYRPGIQKLFHKPIRREFLLESGELLDTFANFEIIFYDESGHRRNRPTVRLLARKPI